MNSYQAKTAEALIMRHKAKAFLFEQLIRQPKSLHWWIVPSKMYADILYDNLSKELRPLSLANHSMQQIILCNDAVLKIFSIDQIEQHRGEIAHTVIFDQVRNKIPQKAWQEVFVAMSMKHMFNSFDIPNYDVE